jgi:hypothetical protein
MLFIPKQLPFSTGKQRFAKESVMKPGITIKEIGELKNNSNPSACEAALVRFSKSTLPVSGTLIHYHDLLLFYCAFPPNKKIFRLSVSELFRITTYLKEYKQKEKPGRSGNFESTGLLLSSVSCSFSYTLQQWLVQKFPGSVILDSCEAGTETVQNILQILLPAIEFEKITAEKGSLQKKIVQITAIRDPGLQLKWLLQQFHSCRVSILIKEELYRQLKIFIQWQISHPFFNRSRLQWPVPKTYLHKNQLRTYHTAGIVKQKLKKPDNLKGNEKKRLIDITKTALAFYLRETDPVTYADSEKPVVFSMERGLQIVIMPMIIEKQLALESYIGYMVFKNGIPVCYGGGWLFGVHCTIGIHIFPPFRKAESGWIFCQILRVYYQYYGASCFHIKPYQFGSGNREGIRSGAYWFYYKLGFRSNNKLLSDKAEREWHKIRSGKRYRTSYTQLKEFTKSGMELNLEKTVPNIPMASAISIATSHFINQYFQGSRALAVSSFMRAMLKQPGAVLLKKYTPVSHRILENWCLLYGMINDFKQWRDDHKKEFFLLASAKLNGNEQAYNLALIQSSFLRLSFMKIAERSESVRLKPKLHNVI